MQKIDDNDKEKFYLKVYKNNVMQKFNNSSNFISIINLNITKNCNVSLLVGMHETICITQYPV